MEQNRTEFVDKTILTTPKPTACSTIERPLDKRKQNNLSQTSPVDLANSLSFLPINEADISCEQNQEHLSDISYQLQQQRVLATSSLQRANKVSSIPSKYLRPNINISSMSNLSLTAESTISESDLLNAPNDASTPRTSVILNSLNENKSRLSLGQSMAELSYKIGNTDISIDNFIKEFDNAMQSLDKGDNSVTDSNIFRPAEEATSMLLADELSWRRQNYIPISNNFSQNINEEASMGKLSVSAFFQQRSDTLSNFQEAVSPEKRRPTPLIDTSVNFSQELKDKMGENQSNTNKSLSITAIQKFLAQTEDTPRKVTNYLLSQGNKWDNKESDDNSLPVSKNSSYTSNYSDNDAMKCIVANKENIQCNEQFIVQGSIETFAESENNASYTAPIRGSSRSSSSLTSLPNGKLPIESTKAELIWGCVKVDRCVTQEFLLRNRTPKRLLLQMAIPGHEFKIRKDSRQDSDPLTAAKILLHPHESRPVIISFIPTKIGAAVDELIFTSLDPNLQQTKKQCVRLFGYGGFGKLEFYNVTKDTTGKFWLSLGKLDVRNVITKNFIIKNTGTLPTFAHISFNSKSLVSFLNINVFPNFFVLIPNEQREITITYIPNVDDHKINQQSFFSNTLIADIGTLLVVSGTEVNRGRLRRLCRKCTEKGLNVEPVSNILKGTIKNEVMPADLLMFKESPSALKEILKLFIRDEIVLTLEQDPEQTIMPQLTDESAIFHSICQDTTVLALENTRLEASCKLEPAIIILRPPMKVTDTLFLISGTNKTLHFEVACEPDGLDIVPIGGTISPGQEIFINVTYPKLITNEKKVFRVLVYVENEVFEATVKVAFVDTQEHRKK